MRTIPHLKGIETNCKHRSLYALIISTLCCLTFVGCKTHKHIEQRKEDVVVNTISIDSMFLHQLTTDNNLKIKLHIVEYTQTPLPGLTDGINTQPLNNAPQREITIEMEQHTTTTEKTQERATIEVVDSSYINTAYVEDKKTDSTKGISKASRLIRWSCLLLLLGLLFYFRSRIRSLLDLL